MRSVLLAAFLLYGPGSASAGHWDPRITDLRGKVSLFPAGSPQEVQASKGRPLENGDRIVTAFGASCEIGLGPGDVLRLSGESDFTLQNMSDEAPELWLTLGSFVSKLRRKIESGRMLAIRTPTAVAAVRGTEFAMDVPGRGPSLTRVAVFDEGAVEVSGSVGAAQKLARRQETSVAEGKAAKVPSKLAHFERQSQSLPALRSRAQYVESHWQPLPPEARQRMRQASVGDGAQPREQARGCARVYQAGGELPPCPPDSWEGSREDFQKAQREFERKHPLPGGSGAP